MPVPTSGFPGLSCNGALSYLGVFWWEGGSPDPQSWPHTCLWPYLWRSPPVGPHRQPTSPPARSSARPASGSAHPAGWWPPSACLGLPPDACTELRTGNTGIHPWGGSVLNIPDYTQRSEIHPTWAHKKIKSNQIIFMRCQAPLSTSIAILGVASLNGNPLQYSCLENAMDRGAWRTTVHGVAKQSDVTEWLTTLLTSKMTIFLKTVLHLTNSQNQRIFLKSFPTEKCLLSLNSISNGMQI